MVIKDEIVDWFIRNIQMPQTEIMNKPGFVVTKFTEKGKEVFLRELFHSEFIFSNIEKQIVKKFGNRGRQALYSAGKKFGYAYSKASLFPTIKESNEKNISSFLYLFVRYAESMWSRKLKHDMNFKNHEFNLEMDDFIICRDNGIGHVMTEGCTAGFWSFVIDDLTVEGVQTNCEGRGDKKCKLICAPEQYLKNKGLKFFKERNFSGLYDDPEEYRLVNQIRESKSSSLSFEHVINSHMMKYSRGVVEYGGFRHFLCEASIFYLLEKELKKIKGTDKIIFDVSFDFGKKLTINKNKEDMNKFIINYMSSLGWGDISIIDKNNKKIIVSDFFPWTKFYNDIGFNIYRGIMSGMVSGFLNKKVSFNKIQRDMDKGYLTLIIKESR